MDVFCINKVVFDSARGEWKNVIVKRAVKNNFMSLYACKIQIVSLKLDDWANLAHFRLPSVVFIWT